MNYQYAIEEPLSLRVYSPVRKTGFRYHEVDEKQGFIPGKEDYNHLIFLVEGKMRVSCNEFARKVFQTGETILIPVAADVKCTCLSPCRILTFSFDFFEFTKDIDYLRVLCKTRDSLSYDFIPLPIRLPLEKFIHLVTTYIKQDMDSPLLHDIKKQELSILFQTFYSMEEIASFFHPLIGPSPEFRFRVLRIYRKVLHVADFAKLFQMEAKTFTRQFKEEFDESPYQWLLDQKSKHILFKLTESNDSLDDIRKEHGFKFPSHFSRFCRDQFGDTALQLRKKSK